MIDKNEVDKIEGNYLLQKMNKKIQKIVSVQGCDSLVPGDNKSKEDNYYLVFTQDTGGREDCSVFYCDLVKAKNKKEALNKCEIPSWERLWSQEDEVD